MPFVFAIVFFLVALTLVVLVSRSEITSAWALIGAVVLAAGLMSIYAISNFVK